MKKTTADQAKTPAGSDPSGTRATILIIDDDEMIHRFMNLMLSREGYHVVLARNRESAFEMLKSTMPDLLLIDMNLGDENGGLLCEEIKNMPGYTGIPILLISGYVLSDQDCEKYRADGFLTKPMDLDAFRKTIRKHIQGK